MQAVRVIPCLDVDAGPGGEGRQLPRSARRRRSGRAGRPLRRRGRRRAGLPRHHGVERCSATPSSTWLARTAEQVFIPFTIGGGIRSVDDARALLRAGADKVSVNTAAVERPDLIGELAAEFGAQCVRRRHRRPALPARRRPAHQERLRGVHPRRAHARPASTSSGGPAEAERLGAGEILLTSMDRDGTRDGFDVELTRGGGRCGRRAADRQRRRRRARRPGRRRGRGRAPTRCWRRRSSTSARRPCARPRTTSPATGWSPGRAADLFVRERDHELGGAVGAAGEEVIGAGDDLEARVRPRRRWPRPLTREAGTDPARARPAAWVGDRGRRPSRRGRPMRSGGAMSTQPASRPSSTVRATSAPNDQPTTSSTTGSVSASASTAATMSRRSSTPWPCSPPDPSTPRKLNRSTARPWLGRVRNSSLVTSERIEPPWSGWGWANAMATEAAGGTTDSASRETPSVVVSEQRLRGAVRRPSAQTVPSSRARRRDRPDADRCRGDTLAERSARLGRQAADQDAVGPHPRAPRRVPRASGAAAGASSSRPRPRWASG